VKADFRLHPVPVLKPDGSPVIGPDGQPVFVNVFGVPDQNLATGQLNPRAPISTFSVTVNPADPTVPFLQGVAPRGLAAQQDPFALVSPAPGPLPAGPGGATNLLPTFKWSLGNHKLDSTLYVSVFPPGQGLFPSDTLFENAASTDPVLAVNGDSNPRR